MLKSKGFALRVMSLCIVIARCPLASWACCLDFTTCLSAKPEPQTLSSNIHVAMLRACTQLSFYK